MFKPNVVLRFPLMAAALTLAVGCAVSPEQALAGSYIVDGKRTELPAVVKMGAGQKIGQAMNSMTLKLRADRTYLLAGGFGAGGGTSEGKWTLDAKGVTLIPKTVPKIKGAPSQIVLTPNAEKNELIMSTPTPFGDLKVVLVKNGT